MTSVDTPVLIVGGGPVGLMLGIDLGWRGIETMIVDRGAKQLRAEHPRMDQVSIRSMEHLRRLGAVEEVERAGYPRTARRDIVFCTGVLGHELEREPMEADAVRPPPAFSPQKHELCPQNFFDPALQRVAERNPLIHIHYDTSLVGFEDRGDHVRAELEDVRTGERRTITSQYLVGCDGAGSFVARTLGLTSSRTEVLARSTNIFLRSPELTRLAAHKPGYRYILIDEKGAWGSIVNMDGRDTWRVQVLGKADGAEVSLNEARTIVERAIGRPVAYEIESIIPWVRRDLVLDHFAKGRCFLVGDAAHQLSPTGGYGMNTGIGEAVDLAWKLEAVLKGWGGEHLLDTYESERRPIALRNVARATVNFRRMQSVAGGPALFAEGAEGDAARAAAGTMIRATMAPEWESMGVHLGYHYAGSPIVLSDGSPEPADDPADYVPSAVPGARAPHVWLEPGTSTLDLFGRHFVLLQFAADADPTPLIEAARARNMPLDVVRIDDPAAARAFEQPLVLVRPDGHVAWRGERADRAALIVDTVRGAVPASDMRVARVA